MSKEKEVAKTSKAEKVAKTATATAIANPTITAAVIGIPIALFLLYKLGKGFQGIGSNFGNTGFGTSAADEIIDKSKATISKAQSQLIASSIYTEIARTCIGNTCLDSMLDKVINIIEPIQNMSDYGLVSSSFGTPRFDGYAEATWPFPQRNLTYWLQTKFKRRPEKYTQLKLHKPFLHI